ncbi:hypothetical protein P2W68_12850 [Chryseobacterium arthrosphaerae]|uniref:hypothetical protein n=1 Tax=Chryseobacterium arthrosphaerae TaxID=651561 RepID=UPI0023E2C92F|nr:hypothetical protein [Chryseobacterium arthrosphaerae]WES95747.1 hypothetical protein P2W68_12850 [Chryseobacterium arthrosphaerae]
MEKPDIINLTFNNTEYNIEIIGNVDKIDSFYYYTFKFDDNHFITISKYDDEKWQIVSMSTNSIAEKLGKIIDQMP